MKLGFPYFFLYFLDESTKDGIVSKKDLTFNRLPETKSIVFGEGNLTLYVDVWDKWGGVTKAHSFMDPNIVVSTEACH